MDAQSSFVFSLTMLLAEIPMNHLKEMPSKFWSEPVEHPKHVKYLIDIIGCVNDLNETKVS